MTASDRRFYSWLGVIFGPLLILGGYGFAFTIEGALLIWLGLALLDGSLLLRTRLPIAVALAVAVSAFVGLSAYTLLVDPGV